MTGRSGVRRDRIRGSVASVSLVALLLAACGSNVSPQTMASTAARGSTDGGVIASGGDGSTGGVDGSFGGSGSSAGGTGTGTGAGTSGTTGGSGTGTTTGSGTGSGSGSGGSGGSEGGSGGGGGKDGGLQERDNCDGLKNQTGITDQAITVANVSDISGPVPGIFESAQQGTRAFAAYFNARSSICGRELVIASLDSRADGGADQQAYTRACDDHFAAVGSMSAFDSGGAGTAAKCGLPDMRALAVTPERRGCATCFSAYALAPNLVPNVMPQFFVKKFPQATKHVAILYVDIGAAAVNADSFRSGWGSNGWTVDYFQGIDTAEFNYAPYVQQMRDKGIRFVVYLGPYQFTVRLQQAMAQQNFKPEVFLQDPTIYDQRYVDEAGEDGEGSYVYSTVDLLDNLKSPEMALYRSWLNQIKPGATPNYYGLYAWSATRLFVEQALALGGDLTRTAMIDRLEKVRNWTSHGLHTGQPVGSKATGNCIKIIQLNKGRWSQVSPGNYICGAMTNTGIGG